MKLEKLGLEASTLVNIMRETLDEVEIVEETGYEMGVISALRRNLYMNEDVVEVLKIVEGSMKMHKDLLRNRTKLGLTKGEIVANQKLYKVNYNIIETFKVKSGIMK